MPRPVSVTRPRAPVAPRALHVAVSACLLPLALLLGGCGYDNDDDDAEAPIDVAEASIDVDAAFEPVAPGQGAGLFIEHGPAGTWRLFTSCDTSNPAGPGVACPWEVWVALADGSRVISYESEGFEGEDVVYWEDPGFARFIADTASDLDGFSFATEPGQPVRVWAYLDDYDARANVNWISGGAAVQGAATNPIDLLPQAP